MRVTGTCSKHDVEKTCLTLGGGNQSLFGLRHIWYDIIRMDQREVNCKGGNWTEMTSRMSNDDLSERCFHVSEQFCDHLDKHIQRNLSYMEPGHNGHMSLVETFYGPQDVDSRGSKL